METVLLIFMLNIESSYLQNVERETHESADTIQFLFHNGHGWRVKTYAIDHDVHVWSLGSTELEKFEALARANTSKHYGDVISNLTIVRTYNGFEGLCEQLRGAGLADNLEISRSNEFGFWVPVSGVYRTQSSPQ